MLTSVFKYSGQLKHSFRESQVFSEGVLPFTLKSTRMWQKDPDSKYFLLCCEASVMTVVHVAFGFFATDVISVPISIKYLNTQMSLPYLCLRRSRHYVVLKNVLCLSVKHAETINNSFTICWSNNVQLYLDRACWKALIGPTELSSEGTSWWRGMHPCLLVHQGWWAGNADQVFPMTASEVIICDREGIKQDATKWRQC